MKINSHWDADFYSETSGFRIDYALNFLKKCGYCFKGDEIVLDIGCGIGDTIFYFLSHYSIYCCLFKQKM